MIVRSYWFRMVGRVHYTHKGGRRKGMFYGLELGSTAFARQSLIHSDTLSLAFLAACS
jgi:hypothetical protein